MARNSKTEVALHFFGHLDLAVFEIPSRIHVQYTGNNATNATAGAPKQNSNPMFQAFYNLVLL